MHKYFMIQVEQDKIIEAFVTHWQELQVEKQDVVQQGQEFEEHEQDKQDINFYDQAGTTGADTIISTNLKYNKGSQWTNHTIEHLSTVSGLAAVWSWWRPEGFWAGVTDSESLSLLLFRVTHQDKADTVESIHSHACTWKQSNIWRLVLRGL